MLLLHIADIHFRHPECASQADPERPFRTMLIDDVRKRCDSLGPVDAVLVGGDIAYAGLEAEYNAAQDWLAELTRAARCSLSDVFVVPGNHDQNLQIVASEASVRNAQQAIIRAPDQHRERVFREQMQDATVGSVLFAPLRHYNLFAARFGCQVYGPEKVFWQQERRLDDRATIRFYGLTSTLLSGAGVRDHKKDQPGSLYLSPYQTAFARQDGIVNVVLSHHPPDWFMDHDDVDDAIRGRACIHLFGHKHRNRIQRDPTYIRFAAGAVSPDRSEAGWEPGYNLIHLRSVEDGDARFLEITAHLLVWQTNPDLFRPKLDLDEQPTFSHRLRIGRRSSPPSLSSPPSIPQQAAEPSSSVVADVGTVVREAAMSEPQARNLVARFWDLSTSQRREIALRFDLVPTTELSLPEPQRYGRALVRAHERGLLDQIAAELDRLEKGN